MSSRPLRLRARRLAAPLLGALLSALTALPAAADPFPYFTDRFPSPPGNRWTTVDGDWAVNDGAFRTSGGKAVANSAAMGDLAYDVDVTFTASGSDAGVMLRANAFAAGPDAFTGYYVGLSTNGYLVVGLENGGYHELTRRTLEVQPDTTYHLRVIAYGDDLRVFVDDMQTALIDLRDATFSTGSVGLRSYTAQVAFDTVMVSGFTVPARPPTAPVANRAPLVKRAFGALPLGSIRADGWLAEQLQLQRNGITGYAEQLYYELSMNAQWLGGTEPDSDWERPPYYLKGLVALAYTLGDPDLAARAQKWIDWALASQQPNGQFGTANNDWWPRMPMLYALRDYYEATGDARVLTFLTNYFHYQLRQLPSQPLQVWAQDRGADNLEVVLWLFNQTADSSLLNLADLLRSQTLDFTGILYNNLFFSGDPLWAHNVNTNQYLKGPAVAYQKSASALDRDGVEAGLNNLQRDAGQVTGLSSGTEFLAGTSSTEGVETCSIAERMQSDETAEMILGDPRLGDALEKAAFNALPGAFDKAFKNHQYYSAPNQVRSIQGANGFTQDYDNAFMPGPFSGFPCCRFNGPMAWPYFTKSLWGATPDGGLAALAYAPNHVTVLLGGQMVTVQEQTNYPFEESIRFTVVCDKPVRFPLQFRIPLWADGATLTVNGRREVGVGPGTFYGVNRTWRNGDSVVLTVPMSIRTSTWINNSVAVERGPLVFSLKMDEQWASQGEAGPLAPGFAEYAVTPANPWNYGLILNRSDPAASVQVHHGPMPANPFLQSTTPVTLTVQAKKVSSWGYRQTATLAQEPPEGPFYVDGPAETVTLVPYGAENIRVTYFPQIAASPALPAPTRYEAEGAVITDAQIESTLDASGGQYVGAIDNPDSAVEFDSVSAPVAGDYDVNLHYANGTGQVDTHQLTVNGRDVYTVNYQPTSGWGRFAATSVRVRLGAGLNTLRFAKGFQWAELDYLTVTPARQRFALVNPQTGQALGTTGTVPGAALTLQALADNAPAQAWFLEPQGNGDFKLRNDAADLVLDVAGVSGAAGAAIDLWSDVGNGGQRWRVLSTGDGALALQNVNSGLLLDATTDGNATHVVQSVNTGTPSERWLLVPLGEVKLINGRYDNVLENQATRTGVKLAVDQLQTTAHWKFGVSASGRLTLVNRASGLALADHGGSLTLVAPGDTPEARWRLDVLDDGDLELVPDADPGLVLAAVSAKGAAQLQSLSGQAQATWRLEGGYSTVDSTAISPGTEF